MFFKLFRWTKKGVKPGIRLDVYTILRNNHIQSSTGAVYLLLFFILFHMPVPIYFLVPYICRVNNFQRPIFFVQITWQCTPFNNLILETSHIATFWVYGMSKVSAKLFVSRMDIGTSRQRILVCIRDGIWISQLREMLSAFSIKERKNYNKKPIPNKKLRLGD